jgi:hypothetical protein
MEHLNLRTTAAIMASLLVIGCEHSPEKVSSADAPIQAAPQEAAMKKLNIKEVAKFDGVGAEWVAGASPWYSVGYGQKLWKWEDFKPTQVAENIAVRHHFTSTSDPTLLTVDGRQFSLSGEKPTFVDSLPNFEEKPEEGYEATEVLWTSDLKTRVASMNFRPPRGMPSKGPDGNTTYTYSRPTTPDGPDSFIWVTDALTGKTNFKWDGNAHSLASSDSHIGFLAGDKLVMVDRLTWSATETEAPGPVNFLAMSQKQVVLVGYGNEAFSYRANAEGALEELLRWPVREGASFVDIHPTSRLVAIGFREPAMVEIWDPTTSTEKPVFTIDGASRAHFHEDGEHLIVANGDRNLAEVRIHTLY